MATEPMPRAKMATDDGLVRRGLVVKMKNKNWEITPAYDICHAYSPGNFWISRHNISVNGKREDINRKDLFIVAESMNIKNPSFIIDEVVHTVSQWKRYANSVGVDQKLTNSIDATLQTMI